MNDSTLDIKAFLDKDEQKDLLRLLTCLLYTSDAADE